MVRSRFDGQIACLNEELVVMGGLCEQAIGKVAERVLFFITGEHVD